jgi:hypothetical protein
MTLFQQAIEKFRARLYWIYQTYFNADERAALDLPTGAQSSWAQWEVASWLVIASLIGCVLTGIFLWSVR